MLFAHERAHLDQNHHRYLLVAELAVAVLPTLRPLAEQLRLATERAADDAAAHAMGNDRPLVARSIAKAAVSVGEYRTLVAGLRGGSVPLRIDALLGPPPRPTVRRIGAATALAVSIMTLGVGDVQLHPVAALVGPLCHS